MSAGRESSSHGINVSEVGILHEQGPEGRQQTQSSSGNCSGSGQWFRRSYIVEDNALPVSNAIHHSRVYQSDNNDISSKLYARSL